MNTRAKELEEKISYYKRQLKERASKQDGYGVNRARKIISDFSFFLEIEREREKSENLESI
jgi:flagellin-specific chaperone FliS